MPWQEYGVVAWSNKYAPDILQDFKFVRKRSRTSLVCIWIDREKKEAVFSMSWIPNGFALKQNNGLKEFFLM